MTRAKKVVPANIRAVAHIALLMAVCVGEMVAGMVRPAAAGEEGGEGEEVVVVVLDDDGGREWLQR